MGKLTAGTLLVIAVMVHNNWAFERIPPDRNIEVTLGTDLSREIDIAMKNRSSPVLERRKRGFWIPALVVGSIGASIADLGLSIENERTDGALWYPSIKAIKIEISSRRGSITSKNKILKTKRDTLYKLYDKYSTTKTHYKAWRESMEETSQITSDMSLKDIEIEMPSLPSTETYNKWNDPVFISQKTLHVSQQIVNSVFVLQMLKFNFGLKFVGDAANRFKASGLIPYLKGTDWTKTMNSFGKCSAAFAAVSIVFSGISIGLGVLQAHQKKLAYAKELLDVKDTERLIDDALASTENSIKELNIRLDDIVSNVNQILKTLEGANNKHRNCRTTKETIKEDVLTLVHNWKTFSEAVARQKKLKNDQKKFEDSIKHIHLSFIINSEQVEWMYTLLASSHPNFVEEIVFALEAVGAKMPMGSWTSWQTDGICSKSKVTDCSGKMTRTRTCKGKCLGPTRQMIDCKSDEDRCLPSLLLGRCSAEHCITKKIEGGNVKKCSSISSVSLDCRKVLDGPTTGGILANNGKGLDEWIQVDFTRPMALTEIWALHMPEPNQTTILIEWELSTGQKEEVQFSSQGNTNWNHWKVKEKEFTDWVKLSIKDSCGSINNGFQKIQFRGC